MNIDTQSHFLKIFCISCQQETPQIDNNTTGNCCQVCGYTNQYMSALNYWTWQELAYFWQSAFFKRQSFVVGAYEIDANPFMPSISFDFLATP